MEEVAREAGVSRALVSLVMRGAPNVSAARRAAVHRAAETLGYTPNRLASRLASRSTQTLGLLLLDLHNPAFADMYDGVARRIADSRHQLMVAVGSTDTDDESAAIKSLVDLRVDGIILAGFIGDPGKLLPMLHGTPTVVLSRDIDVPGIDFVHTDDVAGAALAVDHLYGLGHRRIAHLSKPDNVPYPSRREGYLQAMARLGLEPSIVQAPMTRAGGRSAAAQLFDRPGPEPTAVFSYNDLSAIGAIEEIIDRGLRVPEDVSVVGYDNSDLASSPLLGLTSVDPNSTGLGAAAANLLLDRLAGVPVDALPEGFAPTLVPRKTTAPPPRQPGSGRT
nr:LacI family DNA-binding transcriptional regulator [Arthrobacter sp. SDTb3-6]